MSPPARAPMTAAAWDARYRKGWAYGTEPNAFLREAVAAHLAALGGAASGFTDAQGKVNLTLHLASGEPRPALGQPADLIKEAKDLTAL